MNKVFHPKTILICSVRLIGDVILTTPLIGLLNSTFPDAAIDMLIASGTGGFLEQDPRVRNVLTVASKQVKADSANNRHNPSIKRMFRSYDLAITMNASDRGNIIVIAAAKKLSIGFYEYTSFLKNWWKRLLLDKPLHYNKSQHVILHCKQVSEALDIPVKQLDVKVFWNNNDVAKVSAAINLVTQKSGYFVIHPFARWDYKFWDLNEFIIVSDYLASKYNLTPVWTSSPDVAECKLLESYSAKCLLKPISIAGNFSLNQMACLISGARLYIGLDTAITHIAASTGVPIVALYGPTETFRWFPWNNGGDLHQLNGYTRGSIQNDHIILIQKDCRHHNCIRPNCNNPCMQRISSAEVIEASTTLLNKHCFKHIENGECVANC